MARRPCNLADATRPASRGTCARRVALASCTAESATARRAPPLAARAWSQRGHTLLSRCAASAPRVDMTRVAAVLWSGTLGGAETFTADLCRTMCDLGAE